MHLDMEAVGCCNAQGGVAFRLQRDLLFALSALAQCTLFDPYMRTWNRGQIQGQGNHKLLVFLNCNSNCKQNYVVYMGIWTNFTSSSHTHTCTPLSHPRILCFVRLNKTNLKTILYFIDKLNQNMNNEFRTYLQLKYQRFIFAMHQ